MKFGNQLLFFLDIDDISPLGKAARKEAANDPSRNASPTGLLPEGSMRYDEREAERDQSN